MSKPETPPREEIAINLRDPYLAAFLAWLIPGAGHLYQRRFGKGGLFMICILSTFFYGLFLGGGKVVYASMRENDQRLAYFCQIGVGLPALPALVQAYRAKNNLSPLPLLDPPIMVPPKMAGNQDELAEWNRDPNLKFDLGTLFTMVAGLLNVLAIFDAFGGPVYLVEAEPAAATTPPKPAPKTPPPS
ncbi:MAG TPA: DUF6677 family protein [Pirellulales bacterium]|nr:DUF6677 family protein [Pirellulales bacterium]